MVDRHNKTHSNTSWLWSALLYAVIALLSFSPAAQAQTSTPHTGNSSQLQLGLTPAEKAWLAEHPDIALGIPTTFPPFVIKRNDGTHVGIMMDFMETASRLLNHKIHLHIENPWIKVQEKAENREIDGLALGARSQHRAVHFRGTDAVLNTYYSVFARSKNEYQIRQFSDLKGMRIGYREGGLVREWQSKVPSAELKPYGSNEALTKALLSKEVDVILAWISYDYFRKDKLHGTIDNILLIEEYPIEMVIHVRKDWPELVSILNKVILAMQGDELPQIKNKWFCEWPQANIAKSVSLTPEEQAWFDKRHTVRVRIVDYPPYIIVNNNEAPQGFVLEYLKLIAKRSGVTFKFEVTDQPFAEFLESMEGFQGPDMTPIIMPTPEREQFFSFSETYISSPYVIIIRDQDKPILDINGLAEKTVAIPRGFVVHDKLAKDYPEIKLALFDSDEEALQAVAVGQADAYIGNLTVASHIVHRRGLSSLQVTAAGPLKEQSLAMGNRKDWPELTSIINKALASITEEEKLAISNKYLAIKYEPGIAKAEVLKWVLVFGVGSLTIVLIFIFWNRGLKKQVMVRTSELKQTNETLQKDINVRKQVEERLATSEAKYRGLVDDAIVGVFSTTSDGRFSFVNDALAKMYDFDSSEEMIAEGSLGRWDNPKDRERFIAELNTRGRVINFETKTITRSDRHIDVLFSAKLIDNNIVGMVMDITERKQAEDKLLDYQSRLKSLASQLTLAEEQERRRIATDLHDQVSQNLALSCLQLSAAIQSVDDVVLKKQFDELNQTLISVSKDTRNLIFDLSSPTMHELGLGPAISEWIDDKLIQRHGLDVQLVDKLKRDSLDFDRSAILYRSVRELLTNIVKYARADKVNVLLEQEGNDIRITVKDNGIGFSPEQARLSVSAEGGLGLFSIEERMTVLGGSMVIDSKAHHGTTIVLMIPHKEMEKVTT